jgi:hypothetical protein
MAPLEDQILEKQVILDDLDQQIKHHQFELQYIRMHLRDLKSAESRLLRKIERSERFLEGIKNGFSPVPPPLLDADQIIKNGTAVPNKSGIYFIWQGPLVAYVGQSNNLARRLLNHERLRRNDKISYRCIDSSELFYHEAFYIGICRPSRNWSPNPKVYQKPMPLPIRLCA